MGENLAPQNTYSGQIRVDLSAWPTRQEGLSFMTQVRPESVQTFLLIFLASQ
jgi:selenophosphate synthetase-related protein